MKKIFLVGMLLLSASVFCQEPLTKDQEKKLKTIQKETTKQLNSIVDDEKMTSGEKKSNVQLLKNERDAKITGFMANAQVEAALAKDPVKWDAALKRIDKNETARLKKEKQSRLNEIDLQQKELSKQDKDFDKQIKDLKSRQDDIKKQQKALKEKEKAVKDEYK